jgi:hypothetical protein
VRGGDNSDGAVNRRREAMYYKDRPSLRKTERDGIVDVFDSEAISDVNRVELLQDLTDM